MKKKTNILIYSILIIIVIAILLVQLFAYKAIKSDLEDRYNKELMLIAKQLSNDISTFYKNIRTNLKIFNHINEENDLSVGSAYLNHLNEYRDANLDIINYVFVVKGDKVISLGGSSNECAQSAVKGIASLDLGNHSPIFKLVIDTENECYFTLIGQPVSLRTTHEHIGYVFVAIKLSHITETFTKNVKIGDTGYAWIMDQDGTLISNPKHLNMLYRNIFTSTETCFNCHVSFDMEKKMIAGMSGFGSYYVKTSTNNHIAYSSIDLDSARWSLAVIVPKSEIALLSAKLRAVSLLTFELIFGTILLGGFLLFKQKREKLIFEETAKCDIMIAKSKENFKSILNDIDDIVVLIDTNLTVTFVNAKAISVFGEAKEEESCYGYIFKRDKQCPGCPVNRALYEGESVTIKREITTTDGELTHYTLKISPQRDENGEIIGAVIFGSRTLHRL